MNIADALAILVRHGCMTQYEVQKAMIYYAAHGVDFYIQSLISWAEVLKGDNDV